MSVTTRATYADVLAVPDHQVAEILDGVLIVSPRPAIRHARASSVLGARLGGGALGSDDPDPWVILDEPELHFGTGHGDVDVLVPDLAAWRRSRLPADALSAAYLTVAPDWVCEVISPRSEQVDRAKKARIYASHGVGWLWFINPIARTLEVLQLREEDTGRGRAWLQVAVYSDDDQIAAAAPFALSLDVGALWRL